MLTIKDFTEKFESYSDYELYQIANNPSGYTQEVQEAISIVVNKRGGLAAVAERLAKAKDIAIEIDRVEKEVHSLTTPETDLSFMKTMIQSNILSIDQLNETIEKSYALAQTQLKDKAVTPNTILGSILGCGIASIIGGILWGLQLIYSNAVFSILAIGLFLLCFFIIKLITKKSFKNTSVFVATIVAVILSVVIGQLLYMAIGYRG
jgi:D-serine dehydratase